MKKVIILLSLLLLTSNIYAQMSVQYFGGKGRVSGSNALINVDSTNVIVDCGSFYEEDNLKADNSEVNKQLLSANAMVVTHAHIDHSGRIPLLISEGFSGKIYCTHATKKIIFEIFNDGWNFDYIKQKYFWSNTKMKHIKSIHKGSLTLHWYNDCRKSIKDVHVCESKCSMNFLSSKYNIKFKICKKCLNKYLDSIKDQFVGLNYNQNIKVSDNISFCLLDAGHIAGSSSIKFYLKDKQKNRSLIISGDLGSGYSNILNQKQIPEKSDYVFVESTYGGVSKEITLNDYIKFQKDIAQELKNGKLVWIPSLSLHRTQKVLYEIKQGQDNGIIPIQYPVYSLSPSSNGITNQYENEIKNPSIQKWFSDEVYLGKSLLPQNYFNKKPSKFIKPCIVISASGMMDQGVSLSLINKLLPSKDTTVFLVSYAGPKTPAGKLKNNAKIIKTKYGLVNVYATTKIYDIFSDHPDVNELLKWLINQDKEKINLYLVHGDTKSLNNSVAFYKKKGFKNVFIVDDRKIVLQ